MNQILVYHSVFIELSQDFHNIKVCQKNCVKPKSEVIYCSKEDGAGSSWYSPESLSDLLSIVNHLTERNETFRLVAGNTSTGIFKDGGPYDAYIGLKNVKELNEKKVLGGFPDSSLYVCFGEPYTKRPHMRSMYI